MEFFRRSSRLILGTMLLSSSSLFAATWAFDESHSTVEFSVRHMMITNVKGRLGGIKGTIDMDDKDLSKSKVDVSLEAGTINTENAKRDEHLKSPDFFDVQKFPQIKFVSKKVTKNKDNIRVSGDLTIRGITKPVDLTVDGPTPSIKDPWGKVKRGFSATTKINRKDFGITWNKSLDGGGVVVGDEVKINIEAQLQEKI
jgi:polyisoprenoid-binding protein YceI